MARIFLSHSSSNNPEAVALRDWLSTEGWDDLFLDLDPSRGIAAGERWERRLHEAANRCEAVLFLVSRAWLQSEWCLREFRLAQKLNKRSFGILTEAIPLGELPSELTDTWQFVNLAQGADHQIFRAVLPDGSESHVTFSKSGLQRLKTGLTRAGLDARFFQWPPDSDPDRPPYRGMRPLEAEDAGIFFGREAPTIEALDKLRGMSEAAPPRFLVILGASGAGKSSFLRAGLLPRLARDDRSFLPLPIIRPERAAITGETGLIRSLETALKSAGLRQTRADVKAAIESSAAASVLLAALAERVRAPAGTNEAEPHPPRIVLAVDQAEELFLAEGATEAEAFLRLVRDLAIDPASNLIVVATIRSDGFERLQTAPALEGVRQETLSLPPMPKGAYQNVIEGPAARLAETRRPLKIEPALTAALLADVETGGAKDALPLLAFTLERLYQEHGGDGDLRPSEYRQIGGIKASIDAAVEGALRAADADPAVPRDRAAREALLRRALIPWLAGIDPETGAPRRRVARLSEIPEEARPLVGHLIAARLLATDVSPLTGERTIEPAHEALLRQWGLLQGWLEEDFAALSALEGVQRAARDWDANARDDAWLAHTAGRLDDAEALTVREDFARFLDPTDRAYLAAARAADTAHRDRELEEARKLAEAQTKVARRTRIGLVAAGVLAVAAVGAAAYGFTKAREAETRTAEAIRNESVGLAALSVKELGEGRPAEAVMLALAAWPRLASVERPQFSLTVDSLAAALPELKERVRLEGHQAEVRTAAFSPDGTRVVTASNDKTARIWDAASGTEIAVLKGHELAVRSAVFSWDGRQVLTASGDKTARIWDAATGAEIFTLRGHDDAISSAVFSPDGAHVVTASGDKTARIWDAATGVEIAVLRGHNDIIHYAEFSPLDGTRVVTASWDKTARIWDASTGAELAALRGHTDTVWSAVFSFDGARVVTASKDHTARIWDTAKGTEIAALKGHSDWALSAIFSKDGKRVATTSNDMTARLWDPATGAEIVALTGHSGAVWSAAFSPDGMRVLTASGDRTARVWDAVTGTAIAILKGHGESGISASFSPDGALVVTSSGDKTARIWDVATDLPVVVIDHPGNVSAALSSDGARVVTASEDKTAQIWDAVSGANIAVLRGHDDAVLSAVFSPDDAKVVTASEDKTARIWDATSGANIAVLRGHDDVVRSAAFSPDGDRVVTASEDKTARVWDIHKGTAIVLRAHEDKVRSAIFSPDGARVLTAGNDGTARIWDAATGSEIAVLRSSGTIWSAAFSADGAGVVTTASDTARVWDGATGGLIAELGGNDEWFWSAAFSPDGTRIVTATIDGTARLFDAATGSEIGVMSRHSGPVQSAAFSPDGTRLVTGSGDNTARIWDAATSAEIAVLRGHKDALQSATFSPDGVRLLTASTDGAVRIWDLSHIEKGDAFAITCQRLGSNTDLTEVRDRYRLGEIVPICGDHPPLPVDWRRLE